MLRLLLSVSAVVFALGGVSLESEVPHPGCTNNPLPQDVVFLLDTSGSVKPDMWDDTRDFTVHALEEGLNAGDGVAVMTFDTRVHTLVDWSTDHQQVAETVAGLTEKPYSGGTYTKRGLKAAIDMFEGTDPDRLRKIIMLTDGIPKDNPCYTKIQDQLRNKDIAIEIVVIGFDWNTNKLRCFERNITQIADFGDLSTLKAGELICPDPTMEPTVMPTPEPATPEPTVSPTVGCYEVTVPQDVMFVLDISDSVEQDDWEMEIAFTASAIREGIGADDRVGTLVFNRKPHVWHELGSDRDTVLAEVENGAHAWPLRKGTYTRAGIEAAMDILVAAKLDNSRPQKIVVVSDGKPSDRPCNISRALVQANISVQIVAIGLWDQERLQCPPYEGNITQIRDFEDLSSLKAESFVVCDGGGDSGEVPPDVTTSPGATTTPTKLTLKNVRQSTTIHGGVASRAIDGSDKTLYRHNSCMHTGVSGSGSWWEADFDEEAEVAQVMILNRSDSCCISRLNGSEILVGSTVCVASISDAVGGENLFACPAGTRGNKIRINGPKSKSLNFCEVKVYKRSEMPSAATV